MGCRFRARHGIATLLLAMGATAQAPGFVRTGDGTPFLLVPLKTRTVHWINLHPARLEEEPIAYPGLALAVARSSLLGDARTGDAFARPKRASPLDWEKALRNAPSGGSELVRVDDHVGIRVTFPARSLGPVALLVKQRTRRARLHAIADHYAEVRATRDIRLARTPELGLLRRTLDAASQGRRLGALFVRGGAKAIDEDDAMAFYRWNCHPSRAINILVGGFDPEFVTDVLNAVFREPMPMPERPTFAPADLPEAESTVVSTGDTLMIAHPLPDRHAAGVDLLVELLAGDDDAFLPRALRANGHTHVRVRAQARFPAGGKLLLIQVSEPGLKLGPESLLPQHATEALARLVRKFPDSERVRRAMNAQRARRVRQLASQEGLARLLAEQWVRAAVPDPEKLGSYGRLPRERELQALASTVLDAESRTMVTAHERPAK